MRLSRTSHSFQVREQPYVPQLTPAKFLRLTYFSAEFEVIIVASKEVILVSNYLPDGHSVSIHGHIPNCLIPASNLIISPSGSLACGNDDPELFLVWI